MDCSVIPLKRHAEYSLVQTVDFFYPLIDDPYIMGKIALANVVSDVYAVGVTDIDKLSMIISAPTELSELERDTVVPMIIEGFRDAAKEAGCKVGVQNIALNPWCMIGGIATSVNKKTDIIMPSTAKAGDKLVLTKPLGMQLATNAFIWMQEKNDKYRKLMEKFTDDDIIQTFKVAIKCMSFLNRTAAILMQKHGAHAATDVTGFGLLGHARNLAEFQKDCVLFKIKTLPVIRNVLAFAEEFNMNTMLKHGLAVETSGGLLIALPADKAEAFCEDFRKETNGEQNAWIIGDVYQSNKRLAVLSSETELLGADIPVS